jgi:hypothetical protein
MLAVTAAFWTPGSLISKKSEENRLWLRRLQEAAPPPPTYFVPAWRPRHSIVAAISIVASLRGLTWRSIFFAKIQTNKMDPRVMPAA